MNGEAKLRPLEGEALRAAQLFLAMITVTLEGGEPSIAPEHRTNVGQLYQDIVKLRPGAITLGAHVVQWEMLSLCATYGVDREALMRELPLRVLNVGNDPD